MRKFWSAAIVGAASLVSAAPSLAESAFTPTVTAPDGMAPTQVATSLLGVAAPYIAAVMGIGLLVAGVIGVYRVVKRGIRGSK